MTSSLERGQWSMPNLTPREEIESAPEHAVASEVELAQNTNETHGNELEVTIAKVPKVLIDGVYTQVDPSADVSELIPAGTVLSEDGLITPEEQERELLMAARIAAKPIAAHESDRTFSIKAQRT